MINWAAQKSYLDYLNKTNNYQKITSTKMVDAQYDGEEALPFVLFNTATNSKSYALKIQLTIVFFKL